MSVRNIALVGALSWLVACTQVEQKVAQRTLIEVNKDQVTAQAFAHRLALKIRNKDPLMAKDPIRFDAEKQNLADEFIAELLCKQWAAKNGITVDEKDIETELAALRKQYVSEVAFRQTLAQENLDLEGWKDLAQAQLYRRKVYAKVTEGVAQPTDQELKALFEKSGLNRSRPARIKVRQIVVDKEDVAQRLHSEVLSGKPIGPLAKEYSITAEADSGGVTDWIEKGALEVFDQAFKFPNGSKAKLLKSPYGWHILEVVEKENERKFQFEDLKKQLLQGELEVRKNKIFAHWLDTQLRGSEIRRHETALKSVSISTRED